MTQTEQMARAVLGGQPLKPPGAQLGGHAGGQPPGDLPGWLELLERVSDRDDLNTRCSGFAMAALLERGAADASRIEPLFSARSFRAKAAAPSMVSPRRADSTTSISTSGVQRTSEEPAAGEIPYSGTPAAGPGFAGTAERQGGVLLQAGDVESSADTEDFLRRNAAVNCLLYLPLHVGLPDQVFRRGPGTVRLSGCPKPGPPGGGAGIPCWRTCGTPP